MHHQTLKDKLRLFDFDADTPASGLLFTNRYHKNISFDEILILNRAKELKADAVFFRRMEERNSVPQIFIYDNSNCRLSKDDLIDIHRKLWTSGIVPLYYVFDNTEVRIFNGRKPLKKNRNEFSIKPHITLSLISEVHSIYSATLFQNGSFWELEENKDDFNANNGSYNKLIEGLKNLRNAFIKGQNETACNKLLVLSILVKYLEERRGSNGEHVLPEKYFLKFDNARSFCDVLRKNKGTELFEDLSRDINGKIFELTIQEKKDIDSLNQSRLAEFLDANLENDQYVLWRLYDFNYIPIELISRIYEEFIPSRKDIAYTPINLVDFIIDECMPIESPQKGIKIIDVSCGSGVFLVAAFKRLIQWWQKEQYKDSKEIKSPDIKKLKSILANQIYGVDIEPEAVRLAIFSLTLAVCDTLDPTKMWDELTQEKFVDLSNNIITEDFFDFITTNKKFDLIIGNPPFNPPFKKAQEINGEQSTYWDSLTKKVEFDFDVPDKNIALLFLQQAMKILKNGGLLSLVIPSGPLLYNDTIEFRKNFLEKYNVLQIFDFSSLSGILFHSQNYPVSIIFTQNKSPDEEDILHAVIKRTKTSKEKLYFEIDKYDLYYVPKELAKTSQLIWKTNCLGGGHLFSLVERMQGIRTLGQYLQQKKSVYGWRYGEGYQSVTKSTEKPKKADFLTDKWLISTEKFTDDQINDDEIIKETSKEFHRTREKNKLIFQEPHILIKETPDLPIAFYNDYLIFKNEIIGIYSPEDQKQELIKLRNNIIANRKLYKMLLMSGSGRAGISRSVTTILETDIMALPYPDKNEKIRLSKAEQIICDDIINYGIPQLAEGEKSPCNTENASSTILNAYAKVFCNSLNPIYEGRAKQFYPLEYIKSKSYICLPFAYGNPQNPKKIPKYKIAQAEDGNLGSLVDNLQGETVLYKRIIKLYDRDMVYLIKPNILRYWLKSVALRDAIDVFADLVSSGY